MRCIGKWSFSLYLVHAPCFYLTHKLLPYPENPAVLIEIVAFVMSIAVAWLVNRLIERPGQKLVKRVAGRLYVRILDRLGRHLPARFLTGTYDEKSSDVIAKAG